MDEAVCADGVGERRRAQQLEDDHHREAEPPVTRFRRNR